VLGTDVQSVVIEIFTVDTPVPSTVEVYSRLCSTFSAELFLQSGPECHGEQCLSYSKCVFGLSLEYLLLIKASVLKTDTLDT